MNAPQPFSYRAAGGAPPAIAHCLLCGVAGQPGTYCATCFVALPTPRGEVSYGLRCSKCGGPMRPIAAGDAVVHACDACQSTFVSARAWSNVRREPAIAAAVEAQLPPAAPAASFSPLLDCPVCARQMERGRFAATSDIVIDACHHGDGIWLANGALSRMHAYAEHKARIGGAAAQREADAVWYSQAQARSVAESHAVARALSSRPARYGAGLSAGTVVFIALRLLNACGHVRSHQEATAPLAGDPPAAADPPASRIRR